MLEQPLSNSVQSTSLYEQDFYQWTQEMAIALRARRVSALDWENLAEEIESLGKSDRRSLQSRLEVLLMHLLKGQYQPSKQSNSWRFTITEQRLRIQSLLADSPSLKVYVETELPRSYQNACKLAAAETGLGRETFPANCPYTVSELLNDDLF
ncbi:MAG: DUF29 domain-containing protein [Leptolyngbyaceae cyanobacterium CSU_1_4]|nr:DUF29 domain-containing protein [Leptolyngbyaceae cyanobacterium CSU_1_4]